MNALALFTVPRAGIEPAQVALLVFETSASTYSAIWAWSKTGAKVRYFIDNQRKERLFFGDSIKKRFLFVHLKSFDNFVTTF